jgi:SAM-dependent methyltransferase
MDVVIERSHRQFDGVFDREPSNNAGPSVGLLPKLAGLNARGDFLAVEELCRRNADLAWNDPLLLNQWGLAQFHQGLLERAVHTFQAALALAPDLRVLSHNLSVVLCRMGRREDAVLMYETGVAPWDGTNGGSIPVPRLNAISEGYDDNPLHNYFGRRLLDLYQSVYPGRRMKKVMEWGTGTGLLGGKLPASATEVTGVELSPAMIAAARERKVYDRLVEGRLPDVLTSIPGTFDTILSSGVMCYFADLAPFFQYGAQALNPGGVMLFSTDPLTDAGEIGVTGPGEFAHSRRYLRSLAELHGFTAVALEIDIHRGPPGFWCAFNKA